MTIEELIARLEAADGPSRELDDAIEMLRPDYLRQPHCRYTSSIDAALSLVPEQYDWVLDSDGLAALLFANRACHTGRGKTPAIALCIAALKARAAT